MAEPLFDFENHQIGFEEEIQEPLYRRIKFQAFLDSLPFRERLRFLFDNLSYAIVNILLLKMSGVIWRLFQGYGIRSVWYAARKIRALMRREWTTDPGFELRSSIDELDRFVIGRYRSYLPREVTLENQAWAYANVLFTPFTLPLTHERLDALGTKTFLDEALAALGCSTEEAIEQSRLLIVESGRDHTYAAFLYKPDQSDRLQWIAVQVHDRLHTPTETRWLWAKNVTCSRLATDLMHYHFNIHFLCEAFMVAAYRSFSPDHPIRKLILQADCMSLAVFERARATMSKDSLMYNAFLRDDFAAAMSYFYAEGLDRFTVRNVAEQTGIPGDYPARDDRQRIQHCVDQYARDHVERAFADDRAMKADEELRAFLIDLAVEARVPELPRDGIFGSRERLITVLSHYLMLTSFLHHNNAHDESFNAHMSQIRHFPASFEEREPTRYDEAGLLPLYPSLDRAFNIAFLASGFTRKTQEPMLPHPQDRKSIACDIERRYVEALAGCEETIREQNRTRTQPLYCTLPSRIPRGVLA